LQDIDEIIVILGDLPTIYEIKDDSRCVPAPSMRNEQNR
jgi:hypothetical protein